MPTYVIPSGYRVEHGPPAPRRMSASQAPGPLVFKVAAIAVKVVLKSGHNDDDIHLRGHARAASTPHVVHVGAHRHRDDHRDRGRDREPRDPHDRNAREAPVLRCKLGESHPRVEEHSRAEYRQGHRRATSESVVHQHDDARGQRAHPPNAIVLPLQKLSHCMGRDIDGLAQKFGANLQVTCAQLANIHLYPLASPNCHRQAPAPNRPSTHHHLAIPLRAATPGYAPAVYHGHH
ncbi:hypothetical protein PHLGIDRAFT_363705 [Phlebiopsis gigantea 11061_1 CR5-6]|uniref:Uncharacterized protein n=1 Tax=Phlebiopsis gigantea (strain 11061_1 CR5-6) TaxID=745531 RepID=A0A0C3SCE1_PHLG1|nr:hypothetical protein PHLGIDRAFT_363705 [Phlebiopsis gigantea 11061_1 CR5-6]